MDKLSHAYLITGASDATADAARALSQRLVCTGDGERPCRVCRNCRKAERGIHPDISEIVPEPDENGNTSRFIRVFQLRRLAVDAQILPNEAERKVYIFPKADDMNPNAQNAFLKLLEEPPRWVSFILCSERPLSLLPTVRSRCVELNVAPKGTETVSDSVRQRGEGLVSARNDPVALCSWALALEKTDADELTRILCAARECAMSTIREHAELMAFTDMLAQAEAYLRAAIGVKHTLGYMMTYERP